MILRGKNGVTRIYGRTEHGCMMITGEKPAVAVKVAVSVVIALVAVVAVALFVNVQIVDDANEPEGVRKNKNLQQGKPKCFRETATRSFQHVHRNLSEAVQHLQNVLVTQKLQT